MKGRNVLLSALALLLAACMQTPRSLAPQGEGVLSISVHWPTLQTQSMPAETRCLRFAVKKGDTVLKTQDMPKEASTTSQLRMILKADSGLDVFVTAYRDTYPGSSSVVIAEASASNIVLVPSQVTPLSLHLTPIESARQLNITLGSRAAKPGDPIRISGIWDGSLSLESLTASYSVTFNGVPATEFLPATDSLYVRVPATATTGRVMVQFDGRYTATDSAPILWVANGISLVSATTSISDPAEVRTITASQSLSIMPLVDWVYKNGENSTTYGTPPSVEWLSGDPLVGAPDVNGLFVPLATGTTPIFGYIDTLLSAPPSSPSLVINVVPAL